MLSDTDQRNKTAQIVIAKSLLKLADASKDQLEQLNLLEELANAICVSQFWFLDWTSIICYLHLLAHGEDYEPDDNHIPFDDP